MKIKSLVKKLVIPAAGICATAPVMLGATQITAFASTNGLSAADAVNWVKSYEGQGIDYDGAYGNQCVDLIKAYYDYLGVTPVRGNANTYTYNALPDGWERIEGAEPQPGDILVYTGGSYGHVAIYTGDNESYHQNWGGSYVQKVSGYNFSSMGYWGVIRPDFTDSDSYETDSANVTTDSEYTSESDYSDESDYNYEPDYSYGAPQDRTRPEGYDYGFRPEGGNGWERPWENNGGRPPFENRW